MNNEQLRKIDALIAEKVMDGDIRPYSTVIQAAWEVLITLGNYYSISCHEVIIQDEDRGTIQVNILEDTIEATCTAICLAALKAKGVEYE